MTSILKVTEIQDPTNGNTALTIDSSGRIQVKQNNTATVTYPATGSIVLSGIPSWANKITLVTHNLSPDVVDGYPEIRVTVNGSAITSADYKYSLFRNQSSGTAVVQNEGSGDTKIRTDDFNAANNLINYIVNFYKVDDYIYKFNGTHYNQQYSQHFIAFCGSIETTAAIDGFDLSTATGNFDSGKARAFWE